MSASFNKRKLTVEDVEQIRQQCKAGARPSDVAKKFGISYIHVWYIVRGLRWKK